MNVDDVNRALLNGEIDRPGVFPRLEALSESPVVFRMQFGLDSLPEQGGVLVIRGARQSGKSTWLEQQVRATIEEHGAGSAVALDGDHVRDAADLSEKISALAHAFRKDAPVRRIFIDEITAVDEWWIGLKRVLDRGDLRRILVVTTGSRATDLRRGIERLPGRKGRLARTTFLFLPVCYAEFLRAGGEALGDRALDAYVLSGGSPVACSELIRTGRLAEWVVEIARDWVLGECARTGRHRHGLVAVMQELHRHGGSPLGQTKLAREAGLANNTVAAGWIELLADLLCVGLSPAWDAERRQELPRRPAKFPFINLLVAGAWALGAPRSPDEFTALGPERQGIWYEWAVAQELFRRAAYRGDSEPERIPYCRHGDREIDFVVAPGRFVEVKRGAASALDFGWFVRAFPRSAQLLVVCSTPFTSDRVVGVTLDEFLRGSRQDGFDPEAG